MGGAGMLTPWMRVVLIALVLSTYQPGAGALPQKAESHPPAQGGSLPLSTLFHQGLPNGLVEFYVPNSHPEKSLYPSDPRLAVLDTSGLRIFSVQGTTLVQEFALPHPEPVPWDTLESFPSRGLPGVVLWASEEAAYAAGTVVCYVERKPRVVFEGYYLDFADFDLNGIPEILTKRYASQDSPQPESVTVWAWNGKEYVRVVTVTPDQLWSKAVVDAVRRAKQHGGS